MMLDLSTVVLLMVLYFVLCGGLTWAFSRGVTKTKENFLLANRSFETVRGMFSITAAWTWATALFLVPQLSYQFGFTGFFWVLGMNTISLAIFGFAAYKIRELYPSGFTFAEHIKNHYGRWAHNTYILSFLIVSIIALSLNIYAGSKLIESITGLNMNLAAAFLIISAVIFSMFRGLKSTNVTEIFKMVVVLATSLIVVPQVWNAVGVDVIIKGMSGVTGGYGDLWGSSESIAFFLSTGIYFVFRHISLPWADNSFWQRAFVIKPEKIKITYALAALLFFVSPALFATLGFIGAGMGMTPTNVQLTNVYVIAQILSPWALILVVFMLLTALTSLLDSQITSITTLVSHDIVPQLTSNSNDARSIDIGRIVVISLVLLSWAIVNIPGVNILYFGLLLGCICMTFFVPSVVALFKPELLQSRSMVAGILLALFIGFPLYAYASLNKMVDLSLIGFFACLIISAGVSLIGSKLEK